MYVGGKGAGAAVATTTAVLLPNTGSDMIISLALAVAVGLLTWGVVYARGNRQN